MREQSNLRNVLMVKPFILAILLIMLGESVIAQKKLSIYKTFGGVVFELDSTTISSRQVSMLLRQNQPAYQEFRLARRKALTGNIIGFTSGLLVAVPLITAVAGGQPEWGLAGAGGALFLISLPFNSSFRGHAFNAIEIYNAGVPHSANRLRASFRIYGTGASIAIRF